MKKKEYTYYKWFSRKQTSFIDMPYIVLRYFVSAGEDTFTIKGEHPKQENAAFMKVLD